jgi:hypothetical protein
MVSKDVRDYILNNSVEKLYKTCESRFAKVDYWSEQFVNSGLLDEYELSKALDELTGCYIRFHIIAETLDAMKTNLELDYKVKAFKEAEAKDKKPTISQIEEESRQSTKEFRTYRADFLSYAEAAEKGIISTQARLKRQTVQKAALGVDFTGDMAQPAVVKKQEEQKPKENLIPPTYDRVKDIGWE